MLEIFLFLLTVASWIYWLIACWWTRDFFRAPLEPNPDFTPPVSILKPVKGLDAQAYQNFVSFCQQDYPDFELLFGVAGPTDPVIPVVERLQRDFPERRIRLIVAPATRVNRKASLLHSIAPQACHDMLVVSDSDMRVTPDYLRRVVAPLADEKVGLVTCPYRGEVAVTLTARLEALYMGVTFLPSVLVARRFLNMRFAMGATVALRRSNLVRLGGFAAVADYLADDYQLGVHIANLGLRVHMSNYIVVSVLGATTFQEQWNREVRWARCSRVSRPWEYPGLLLTFSTPLAVVLAVVSGFRPWAWPVLAVSLLLRWMVAFLVTSYTGNQAVRRWLFWLPVRDMLTALVWCVGEMGRHVVWRGEEFVVRSDGRLELLPVLTRRFPKGGCPVILKRMVRGLDTLLRRYYGIYEFSHEEGCLFRLSIVPSPEALTLADGTRIHKGESIGELHLWNEHMPQVPKEGADLAWALTFWRRMLRTLSDLAVYVEIEPSFRDIKAFCGTGPFDSRDGLVHLADPAERVGFDVVSPDDEAGPGQRFIDFWKNLYVYGLIWTFNPASLKGKRLRGLKRVQLWISRGVLIARHGANKMSYDQVEGDVNSERLPVTVDVHELHAGGDSSRALTC
jgi:ceramide glucosyltransferase